MKRLRIGTVGYLNARPLVDALAGSGLDLVADHPAGIARRLEAGEVDVALVPVVAALRMGAHLLPGWCIGAHGDVASVLLVAETPPEAWTRVVLDGESRTSQILARLLLADGPLAARVRPDLVVDEVEPGAAADEARGTTAGLVIGDAALRLSPRHVERIDLAGLWTAWTGLPFVFATWASREVLDPAAVAVLREAGTRGVATLDERHRGEELRYLRDHIRYPFDEAALCGLRRFAALAAAEGFLPRADVPIHPPAPRRARQEHGALLAAAAAGQALDPSGWLRLATEARTADLVAAAEARRAATRAELVVECRTAVGIAASRPDVEAWVGHAVAAGLDEVHLLGAVDPARLESWVAGAPRLAWWVDAVTDFEALVRAGATGRRADGVGLWDDGLRRRLGADPAALERLRVRAAARAGLGQRLELIVGQGEDAAARVRHLLALREAIGEDGGVEAVVVRTSGHAGPYGEVENTAHDLARWTALSVLVLDGLTRFWGAPDTEGLAGAQLGLWMGLDGLGVVLMEGEPAGWGRQLQLLDHHLRNGGRPWRRGSETGQGRAEGPARRSA